MAKWADWCITKVRYNAAGTHIDAVKARSDNGTALGEEQQFSRQQVVSSIEAGTSFITVYTGSDNNWKKGAPVDVVLIDYVKFLKTEADKTKRDNLGNLPTF
jgi:hypothetical protein